MTAAINTANDQFVGAQPDCVAILKPRACGPEEALRLAAWLLLLSDHTREDLRGMQRGDSHAPRGYSFDSNTGRFSVPDKPVKLTKTEALQFAAWLEVLGTCHGGPDIPTFEKILEAIENT